MVVSALLILSVFEEEISLGNGDSVGTTIGEDDMSDFATRA